MDVLVRYMFLAVTVMLGIGLVHGYDSKSNFRKIDFLETKLDMLEIKLDFVIKELKYVKEDLKEEKGKNVRFENQSKDENIVGPIDYKDSDLTKHHSVADHQEVGSQAMSVEQRIYNAMKDEKNVRKQFEKQMKADFMTANKHTEIKFITLKETLSAIIDHKLDTIEDKVHASVAVLNDASSSMANLTIQVRQNDDAITSLMLESDKLNTTLLRCVTRLETIEDDLANNVKQNDEYITNLKTESESLNKTLFRHGSRLEIIADDLANNVKQNDEYITNLKTESDQLNTTVLKHGTKLETIEDDLANNVKQNDEYITNLKTESESLNKTLFRHGSRLESIADDLANNVKQNDEYITNLKTESDQLNTTVLKHGTELETIEVNLANNVQHNDEYITNLKTESDQHGAILISLNGSLFDVRTLVEELIDTSQRYKVCYHGGKHSKDGECECSQPYYGTHCEKGVQLTIVCFNGGKQSEDGLCVCTLPYYGTQCEKVYMRDCNYIKNTGNPTGIYEIQPRGLKELFNVYCDMDTDGGGWTVFQYRYEGSVDFYRNFTDYKNGFGSLTGEFWLGLQYIHVMTSSVPSVLRIDVAAADGTTAYQTYDDFKISEGPDYKLNIGATSGTAGDGGNRYGISYYNGQPFTTYDLDRDEYSGNCADKEYMHGAWWYNSCGHVNPNGEYPTPGTTSTIYQGWGGMIYYPFKQKESLKSSKIMFRRK